MKQEKYLATDKCPSVARCADGRLRVKTVLIATFKNPDGNEDYQGYWAYRLPKSKAEILATRRCNFPTMYAYPY